VKVYLAGGMKTNWRKVVKDILGEECCLDPCDHDLRTPKLFTGADLYLVRISTIVLGYCEHDNPSALGLTAELAYGKALDKLTILVDERTPIEPSDSPFIRHFAFVHSFVDIELTTLDEAIEFLLCLKRACK
jgi:hypothetical protein